MKIKTSKATELQLNWLVAKCEGYEVGVLTAADVIAQQLKGETDPKQIEWIKEAFADFETVPCFVADDGYKSEYSGKLANRGIHGKIKYSTNPAQAWPIIDRVRIHICPIFVNGYEATQAWVDGHNAEKFNGPTGLIAAMRCYVASKMGDEVDIPEELTCP